MKKKYWWNVGQDKHSSGVTLSRVWWLHQGTEQPYGLVGQPAGEHRFKKSFDEYIAPEFSAGALFFPCLPLSHWAYAWFQVEQQKCPKNELWFKKGFFFNDLINLWNEKSVFLSTRFPHISPELFTPSTSHLGGFLLRTDGSAVLNLNRRHTQSILNKQRTLLCVAVGACSQRSDFMALQTKAGHHMWYPSLISWGSRPKQNGD